ncbi:hypothetical protein O181_050655 [Austropuccinia psidii MF-1]|uniref:Uncharacterized protein n=1 Tax=Austropuccinia psidii MF-1 TaxID=1389203 RepID=A0A9Q3HR37_9BASI|nr:hypothetical protein [Austropuccinia psidii MF-1]
MSCHPLDSNSKVKPNQPNPPQQDSTFPSLPFEQTPRQPTPGLSGTQWSGDSFCGKQPDFHLISTLDSSELTVPPFVEPSQKDEPPIPDPTPSSKPLEDVLTSCPTSPHSVITITNMPAGSQLPPNAPKSPTASSHHSHDDACQEFTDLRLTLMIP